ncbi:MAG: tRNA (adenosine(37)-N6)-threonylcarbamoyltransferase complex ATPase subunit type 1 TsaE [Azoarcus sp.]|nr:tRNA (adenosine(37)-N6)-threonylcarbamoyltransferase complex ATPase subunit type 1 TsaE [Azoarcus sp.]
MIQDIHLNDDTGSGFSAHLADEADTERAGAALAEGLVSGLVIYLVGDLGAGKTTLVRGCLRGLGHTGKVKSPTYTLIEPYVVSRLHLYHFDFYRFNVPEEFLEAGLEEYFSGSGACLVEWPGKAEPYIANADIEVRLSVRAPGRDIEVEALTETGRRCVHIMMSTLQACPS